MKKVVAVLSAAVLVLALVSLSVAAEMKMGTVKSVDAKKHSVVFCPEGTTTDMHLKAAKGVDLSNVKAGDKVEVSVEKHSLKSIKAAPAPAAAPAAPAEAPAKPKVSTGC